MTTFFMLAGTLLFILCFTIYYIAVIFRLSDYESELKRLDRRIERYGGAYDYYLRGRLYSFHDDYRCALSDFDRAINLEPHNIEYYLDKAALHRKFKRDGLVWETFNDMIRANPEDYRAYHHRAFHLLKVRQFEAAVSDYLKVKEFCSERIYLQNYHIFKAIDCYYKESYEESLENLKIAADIYPQNLIYIFNYIIYCKCKDYDKVLDNFKELKERCALEDDTYHLLLGEFYKEIGDSEKACENYKAAISRAYKSDEEPPHYYYVKGNIELLQGNEKSAARLFDEYLDYEEHREFLDHFYEMLYHISRIKSFILRNDVVDAREELKFIDKHNDLYYTCLPFLDGIISQVQGSH